MNTTTTALSPIARWRLTTPPSSGTVLTFVGQLASSEGEVWSGPHRTPYEGSRSGNTNNSIVHPNPTGMILRARVRMLFSSIHYLECLMHLVLLPPNSTTFRNRPGIKAKGVMALSRCPCDRLMIYHAPGIIEATMLVSVYIPGITYAGARYLIKLVRLRPVPPALSQNIIDRILACPYVPQPGPPPLDFPKPVHAARIHCGTRTVLSTTKEDVEVSAPARPPDTSLPRPCNAAAAYLTSAEPSHHTRPTSSVRSRFEKWIPITEMRVIIRRTKIVYNSISNAVVQLYTVHWCCCCCRSNPLVVCVPVHSADGATAAVPVQQ